MSSGRPVLLLLLALAGCGPNIANLAVRPQKYYEEKVEVVGRVSRLHAFSDGVLLEIANPQERRVLVRAPADEAPHVGDWVKVRGVFVPELQVGDRVVYDVIAAERVRPHRAPLLPNLL